jgi:predicted short-subunit dehydrogenase-like oxidoreductase (DUF2520 family)
MLTRCMARTVSIIGAGRVGASLARLLRARGWRIGAVVTRSPATARAAVRAIGAGTPSTKLAPEASDSQVIVVAVPDTQIAIVAASLARIAREACRDKIILHTSGALDRSVLAPLARLGAFTGSLHPMQTFSGRGAPNLKGVVFAVEGDARALRTAAQIARQLGGIPVKIDGSGKAAYHAAGALAAGHALALIESAVRILIAQGFSRRRALATLLPLTRQMLENFERLGPRAAWTGPIARGDFAVVARHANALKQFPREFAATYAALAHLGARVLAKNPGATISRLKRALKNS